MRHLVERSSRCGSGSAVHRGLPEAWKAGSIKALRKLLSILLLLACVLPCVTPLFALGRGAEWKLPLCCRRNGAHHCAMHTEEPGRTTALDGNVPHDSNVQDGNVPQLKALMDRCPYCPATIASAHPHHAYGPPQGEAQAAVTFSHPAGIVQSESRRRVARDRSRQKRGPPSVTS